MYRSDIHTYETSVEINAEWGCSDYFLQIDYKYEPSYSGSQYEPPEPAGVEVNEIRYSLKKEGPFTPLPDALYAFLWPTSKQEQERDTLITEAH